MEEGSAQLHKMDATDIETEKVAEEITKEAHRMHAFSKLLYEKITKLVEVAKPERFNYEMTIKQFYAALQENNDSELEGDIELRLDHFKTLISPQKLDDTLKVSRFMVFLLGEIEKSEEVLNPKKYG